MAFHQGGLVALNHMLLKHYRQYEALRAAGGLRAFERQVPPSDAEILALIRRYQRRAQQAEPDATQTQT
jgi:hypothetical protein